MSPELSLYMRATDSLEKVDSSDLPELLDEEVPYRYAIINPDSSDPKVAIAPFFDGSHEIASHSIIAGMLSNQENVNRFDPNKDVAGVLGIKLPTREDEIESLVNFHERIGYF